MADRQLVFVAYPARDLTLAETVMDAVRRANALPLPILYQLWPFNDVPGNPVVSPILEKIDDSPFVIAEITYLNPNVVYEVGFAIGRCKRAFLIRHRGTNGDKDIAKAVGIFDTLGYHEYGNGEDLKNRLAAHIETTHLRFSTALDRNSRVYLIEPPTRGDDVAVMVSRIKKAGYGRYRSFTPEEDSRLSATDAIRQVGASSGVFIPLQSPTIPGAVIHNIRCMFIIEALYAGFVKSDEYDGEDNAGAFAEEINEFFVEEGIGWQLVNGRILTRGTEAFEALVTAAIPALEASERPTAAKHLHEALQDLSRRPEADLPGAVYHAMGSFECVARDVSGDKGTLGDILKRQPDLLPKPLDKALSQVWGYSSEVARHVREGQEISRDVAELLVGLSAAVSTYLSHKLRR
jgi:hypothetical protein